MRIEDQFCLLDESVVKGIDLLLGRILNFLYGNDVADDHRDVRSLRDGQKEAPAREKDGDLEFSTDVLHYAPGVKQRREDLCVSDAVRWEQRYASS